MTRLAPEQLVRRWPAEAFDFESTASLEPLAAAVGQHRALDALELAVGVDQPGFNLFVVGAPETGRFEATQRRITELAAAMPVPDRWCYVNNFHDAVRPSALRLPGEAGARLRDDMRQLVEELRSAIPAVLESDEYRSRVEQIEAHFASLQEQAFGELVEDAQRQGIALLRTPAGFSFAPAREGEVMPHEEFEKLPAAEKERIAQAIRALQEKLERILRQAVGWRREHRDEMKKLNREVTTFAVGHLVDDLLRKYVALPDVVAYLEAVAKDVVENADIFRAPAEGAQGASMQSDELPPLRRYQVNLLVEDGASGAPVVSEENPTFQNLIGRVEHVARFGALMTDFGLIRAGALHRANGGYLLLDARKVLMQPLAWEALKRALLTREIRVESPAQQYGLISTVSLEPQPIPLDVKVVLFGDRMLHALLQAWDPEFVELFKVDADFEDDIVIDDDSLPTYARLIGTLARDAKLPPLEADAVARVIEHAARDAGDRGRVSLHVHRLRDLIAEAAYQAGRNGRERIGRNDVQAALDARRERTGRVRRRLQDQILEGTVLIDTAGARPGQINGLSVYVMGETAFAQPTRITATTRIGEGNLIDIQREASLSGSIHAKGVMILSAFLASRYAARQAFALNASLAFEQTYGPIDGDSASLAELCAILSSISGIPIRQNWAVTGSIDQAGHVQAIGAVNEKIEGFYDICAARGLDGRQGVLIPATNVRHLMLRDDVVGAVRDGRFAVHAVSSVDEAMALLTGRDDVDAVVRARLAELGKLRQKILAPAQRNRQARS
ncbi:MAG TPA: AAA family ATPase [Burkholderiaceae bacterium]|jgi:lon-related putative ATP-dependent protease|nr:AAA family ATPase [Burkholderiaceae bacterium]HMN66088.1 AAA family ATPase [Burkholderiaceae bacterium]